MCIRRKKESANEQSEKDSKIFSIGFNMKITFNYIFHGTKKRADRKS